MRIEISLRSILNSGEVVSRSRMCVSFASMSGWSMTCTLAIGTPFARDGVMRDIVAVGEGAAMWIPESRGAFMMTAFGPHEIPTACLATMSHRPCIKPFGNPRFDHCLPINPKTHGLCIETRNHPLRKIDIDALDLTVWVCGIIEVKELPHILASIECRLEPIVRFCPAHIASPLFLLPYALISDESPLPALCAPR